MANLISSVEEFLAHIHKDELSLRHLFDGKTDEQGQKVLKGAYSRQFELAGLMVDSALELAFLTELKKGNEEGLEAGDVHARLVNRGLIPEAKQAEALPLIEAQWETMPTELLVDALEPFHEAGVILSADELADQKDIEYYHGAARQFTDAWDSYEKKLEEWRKRSDPEEEPPAPPYMDPNLYGNASGEHANYLDEKGEFLQKIDYKTQPVDPRIQAFNKLHGVEVGRIVDPGPKMQHSAERKLADTYKGEGGLDAEGTDYNAAELGDVNRISIGLNNVESVECFNRILSQKIEALNIEKGQQATSFFTEGWDMKKSGYMVYNAFASMPAEKQMKDAPLGTVAEIKTESQHMQQAYQTSHHLYEVMREIGDKKGNVFDKFKEPQPQEDEQTKKMIPPSGEEKLRFLSNKRHIASLYLQHKDGYEHTIEKLKRQGDGKLLIEVPPFPELDVDAMIKGGDAELKTFLGKLDAAHQDIYISVVKHSPPEWQKHYLTEAYKGDYKLDGRLGGDTLIPQSMMDRVHQVLEEGGHGDLAAEAEKEANQWWNEEGKHAFQQKHPVNAMIAR